MARELRLESNHIATLDLGAAFVRENPRRRGQYQPGIRLGRGEIIWLAVYGRLEAAANYALLELRHRLDQ